MKYYRLLDDVNIKGRWHLGEAVDLRSGSSLELLHGSVLNDKIFAKVEMTHAGKPLEFCLSSFGVPIVRKNLALAIAESANGDLQLLHVNIHGHEDFYILNCVRIVDCLDEKKSEFVKWTTSDHRSDLAGQYRMVMNLTLNALLIPLHTHFFRIDRWPVALIVSETVKSAMEKCGCFGARFQDVN